MRDADMPDPLPESWLPEPASEAGDADWEERVTRIVSAAEPRLRQLGREPGRRGSTPRSSATAWLGVERWWRPAAALAAAAVLALVLTDPGPRASTAAGGSPALGAVVSQGEPASLWAAAGRDAHPVLALVALEEESP